MSTKAITGERFLEIESSSRKRLERFLKMPTDRSPLWLDEESIAFLRRDENGSNIWKLNSKTGEEEKLTDREIRSFWISCYDGYLYYGSDADGSECEQLYKLCPRSKQVKQLTNYAGVRHFLAGVQGDRIAYASNKRTPETFDIWTKDIKTGEERLVAQFSDHYNWPSRSGCSPNGRYVLYNKLRGESDNPLWITDLQTEESYRIPMDDVVSAETEPVWKGSSEGFYYLSDRESDFIGVWYHDMVSGKEEKIYSYSWDAYSLSVSSDDKYLAVLVNEAGYSKVHVYDMEIGEEINLPEIPQGVISYYQNTEWSSEDHRMLFTLAMGTLPECIWMLDVDNQSLKQLTHPVLVPEDKRCMVNPVLCSYRSFDGLEVPYWLYVPAGKQAKELSVLIEIHGGPEGQEMPGFHDFIQYLVSEGIAVVAPNVRGSTGYGKVYTHLDDVEKRLDSVKDVEYLVKHLVSEGIAHRDRIAVSGTSYGGFMTLSCASRNPDLWACAVDTVGMYDLVTFLENTADYRRAHRESEYGTLANDRELLKRVSPSSKIKDIVCPIMIIQGRNDPRVPVTEAEQAVEALRGLNREVEYLCYDDEGHGILKLTNRLDCYPKVAGFIKKYLGA